MEISFDHLVHAVVRPEEAAADFGATGYFRPVTGGEHPNWGTYNTLAYFSGLSYIEWIGVRNVCKAQESTFGQQMIDGLENGQGPIQFALRTDDISAVAAAWRARGLSFEGPIDAHRTQPDGSVIRWRMLFPKQRKDKRKLLFPFLIEWATPTSARAADFVKRGILPKHPSDLLHLHAVYVVLTDFQSLAPEWNLYYGGLGCALPEVPIHGDADRYDIQFGSTTVVFTCAKTPEQQAVLQQFGERPYRIDLTSRAVSTSVWESDLHRKCLVNQVQIRGLEVFYFSF